jgi:hypothetical protein
MLDTLSAQLNLSAIVDSILGNWHCHFWRNWSKFAKLTILLFHNKADKQVDNMTTATDLAVLLPVQDRPIPDCSKKHIRFVRVQLNLDFVSLVTLNPPGITAVCIEYYIECPKAITTSKTAVEQHTVSLYFLAPTTFTS